MGLNITIPNTYAYIPRANAIVRLVVYLIVGLNGLATNVKPMEAETKSKVVEEERS